MDELCVALMEGTTLMEEGVVKEGEVGAEAVVVVLLVAAAVVLRDFSIMSARQLRVELRAFEMITGFRSPVLLLDALLELGSSMLSIVASNFHFQCWLLPMEPRECMELIEMSP
jgi:hypothetical protein